MKPAPPAFLGIMLTDRCLLRCRHCLYACSPSRTCDADAERVDADLEDMARLGWRHVPIHLGGGEPFLVFETLRRAVRAAASRGFTLEFVETSGAWFADESCARELLCLLRQEGLRRLLVSATPFHVCQTNPRRIRRLVSLARSVFGTRGVVLERRSPLTLGGRAPRALRGILPRLPAEAWECACAGALLESRRWHVGPDGRVHTGYCAGLAFPAPQGLESWYRGFRMEDWGVARMLAEGGLRALLERARSEAGFVPDESGYVSACQLCQEARTALWRSGRYAELGPDGFYRELEADL